MKLYFFEAGPWESPVYHSEPVTHSEANKQGAKVYCETQHIDVDLYSVDDGMGRMYARWHYNDGDLKYERCHG